MRTEELATERLLVRYSPQSRQNPKNFTFLSKSRLSVRLREDSILSCRSINNWAEPVKAGLTRVLLVNLGIELDRNRIYALPMHQGRTLDYQIPIDVLRFDGTLGVGREVVLGARWTLLGGDGKKLVLSKVSRIHEPVKGNDVSAFVDAQSRALARLSAEIAQAIKEAEARPGTPSSP